MGCEGGEGGGAVSPREYAKANRHIGEAWEDRKDIQFRRPEDGINEWVTWLFDFRPPFEKSNTQWRIKPEPPKPKYRDWTYEEMSSGLVLKPIVGPQFQSQIVHVFPNGGVLVGSGIELEPKELREGFLCKWPHEDNTKWRPCGVEVKE
jgi:hypothetical protein